MKIGFIGLGTMGASIAMNALKGNSAMVVHDINRKSAEQHLSAGAEWADSPRAVAAQADVVFTSLPGPREVEAVALGEDGLGQGLAKGKAYFDLSTNSPTVMRQIHAELGKQGINVLDAPVSGGPDGARSGKLAIWVGGDRAVFEEWLPVLRTMSDQPMYVGPIGAGSIAKLVHNCSGYVVQQALAECFTMGVKAGLEPGALFEAVRMGAHGRRRMYDGLARQYFPHRFDPADFALALARKDVALAVEVGRDFDVPMRLANLTLAEMTEAMNRGWEKRDSRSFLLLQEERADAEVMIDPERLAGIMEKK